MLDKHIRKIEPIIEELKGKRIEKVDGSYDDNGKKDS